MREDTWKARWRLILSMAASSLSLVAIDQGTKIIAASRLAGRGAVRLAGGFVVLVYAQNKGAFLSLGSGLPPFFRGCLLIVLPAIVLVFLAWALVTQGLGASGKTSPSVGRAAAVLVLAGGAGNLIDRIAYGEVRDFLNFRLGPFRSGIMNVADIYILSALVVVVVALALPKGMKKAKDDGRPPDGR